MSKLTLSVKPEVVRRAKRYAQRQGTSVSHLVESYLASLGEPISDDDAAPILRQLRGILKGKANLEDYRKYLRAKYL